MTHLDEMRAGTPRLGLGGETRGAPLYGPLAPSDGRGAIRCRPATFNLDAPGSSMGELPYPAVEDQLAAPPTRMARSSNRDEYDKTEKDPQPLMAEDLLRGPYWT